MLLACSLGLVLAGCGTSKKKEPYEPENFGSTTTHARTFDASEAQTCEASRRALLSQGYLVTAANSELVTGNKSFQPSPEMHVEVTFRIVCAKDVRKAKNETSSIAFVSAIQDRYGLKKSANSASVGVGMIGSLSLPYSASDDAMVKVASQTVTDDRFYDRFYALVERYIQADEPLDVPQVAPAPQAAAPAAKKAAQPAPAAAAAAGAAAASTPATAPAPAPATPTASPAAPSPAASTAASPAPAAAPADAAKPADAKPADSAAAKDSKPVEPLGEPASMPKAGDPADASKKD